MRFLYLLIYLCISFIAPAQKAGNNSISIENGIVKFDKCDLNPFAMDDGSLGVEYSKSESLSSFFKHNLSKEIFDRVGSEIILQLLIDKNGKACCKSASSSTLSTTDLVSYDFPSIIRKMKKWRPAIIDSRKWNSTVVLSLQIINTEQVKIVRKTIAR